MSFVGQMFRLFSEDLGPGGYVVLFFVALAAIWFGVRYSRRPPPPSVWGPSAGKKRGWADDADGETSKPLHHLR